MEVSYRFVTYQNEQGLQMHCILWNGKDEQVIFLVKDGQYCPDLPEEVKTRTDPAALQNCLLGLANGHLGEVLNLLPSPETPKPRIQIVEEITQFYADEG